MLVIYSESIRKVSPCRKRLRKLELQVASYTLRLSENILESHDIEIAKMYHWIDSLTVIQGLHSVHKKQQVFAANRRSEFLDSLTVDEWRYVKGTLKPAEIETQGTAVS